jgi:hypothetical protein
MMAPHEFDNLVWLAKERQAKLLAEVEQDRLLKELAQANPRKPSAWQRLHHAVVNRLHHIHLHWPRGPRHATQHH